jgi:hypothetical protein
MIIVIQCAASKRSGAGHLVSASGKPVIFVADPNAAPADPDHDYARPDDPSGSGLSWRQVLVQYNMEAEDNPLGLYPAYRLYQNGLYEQLIDRFGSQKVYILSAGWGLIRADFLTLYYDITFSQNAEKYKRRTKAGRYQDFCALAADADDDILFFGGKDYVPLFNALTKTIRGIKTVFYNSKHVPNVPGCTLKTIRNNHPNQLALPMRPVLPRRSNQLP